MTPFMPTIVTKSTEPRPDTRSDSTLLHQLCYSRWEHCRFRKLFTPLFKSSYEDGKMQVSRSYLNSSLKKLANHDFKVVHYQFQGCDHDCSFKGFAIFFALSDFTVNQNCDTYKVKLLYTDGIAKWSLVQLVPQAKNMQISGLGAQVFQCHLDKTSLNWSTRLLALLKRSKGLKDFRWTRRSSFFAWLPLCGESVR